MHTICAGLLAILIAGCEPAPEASSPVEVKPAAAPSVPVQPPAESPPPPLPIPHRKPEPPQPLIAVEDRFVDGQIIATRESPPATQPRVKWETARLMQVPDFKYPTLRVVERWQVDGGKAVRVQQSAMVADHVMVKLTPGTRIDEVLRRFSDERLTVRKHSPASGIYLLAVDEPSLDTVPTLLATLNRARDAVRFAEPDWIAR
jgi:hypothetical protein